MKLYVRTSAGQGLALDVRLTTRVRETRDGKLLGVEIHLPAGCVGVVGFNVVDLSTPPDPRQLLWADVKDFCADDGSTLTQDQVRAVVDVAKQRLREEMQRGPLGEDWP